MLTDAGLEELRRIWAVYSASIAEYFAGSATDEELETIERVCGRIRDELRGEDGFPLPAPLQGAEQRETAAIE